MRAEGSSSRYSYCVYVFMWLYIVRHGVGLCVVCLFDVPGGGVQAKRVG